MSGTIPKFLEGEPLPPGYFEAPDPFRELVHGNVNLLELSRYAIRNNKRLVDLTKEEVAKFRQSLPSSV